MASWTAISRDKHINSRWQPRSSFEFAASIQLVEVVISEIALLLPHYVLGLIEHEGEWKLVALLGLGGEQNLYVNASRQWLCEVVPYGMQGYPFSTFKNDDGEYVLCIREDHLTDGNEGHPLFTEAGEPTADVMQTLQFLQQCEEDKTRTRLACKSLAEAGVVEPWAMEINTGEAEPVKIQGLQRISQSALNAIDADTLLSLRDSFGLYVAHGHLFSLQQIRQLITRVEQIGQELSRADQHSVGELFGDQGSISFDSLGDD